jgi:phosphoribosylformylglycinamidine synthase
VGLIPDITKICSQGWQKVGDLIYVLGIGNKPTLGGSEYLASLHGIVAGKPPKVNINTEILVQKVCRNAIRKGWVQSAHDCSEGGLGVALAECCISGRLGANIFLQVEDEKRLDELLFGEVTGQIIISVSLINQNKLETYLNQELSKNWQKIGKTSAKSLNITTSDNLSLVNLDIKQMLKLWSTAIERKLKV